MLVARHDISKKRDEPLRSRQNHGYEVVDLRKDDGEAGNRQQKSGNRRGPQPLHGQQRAPRHLVGGKAPAEHDREREEIDGDDGGGMVAHRLRCIPAADHQGNDADGHSSGQLNAQNRERHEDCVPDVGVGASGLRGIHCSQVRGGSRGRQWPSQPTGRNQDKGARNRDRLLMVRPRQAPIRPGRRTDMHGGPPSSGTQEARQSWRPAVARCHGGGDAEAITARPAVAPYLGWWGLREAVRRRAATLHSTE